jgi:hypothetical protein
METEYSVLQVLVLQDITLCRCVNICASVWRGFNSKSLTLFMRYRRITIIHS